MLFRSLSGRLLVLTVVFVMVAEVAIFVPSVARFRETYLIDRLERAQIASLALLATPNDMVSADLESELLDTAGVSSIVLQRDAMRELILSEPAPSPVDVNFDLRGVGAMKLIVDALSCAIAPPGRVMRVIGLPKGEGGEWIEITLPEDPLRRAMLDYGLRVLVLSLVISAVTAVLIVLSIRRFVVAPMTRVIDNMRAFQGAPEDAGLVMRPSSGIREIAEAEQALADMEIEMRAALRQRARLAALGEAMAKISHDLRNAVTTAQLFADRVSMSGDPSMRRIGPKLIRSLDRAAALCAATLDFGRAEEPEPELRAVHLSRLVEDVRDEVFPDVDADAPEGPRLRNAAPEEVCALADPDHLHRILANLARNARQAIEASGRCGLITIAAEDADGRIRVRVIDDGPGLPAKAQENLFTAFKGGARAGGSGLGLAIAEELARSQGGTLRLERTGADGTAFVLELQPAAGMLAGAARDAASMPETDDDRLPPQARSRQRT